MTDFILQNVPGSGPVTGNPGFWAAMINNFTTADAGTAILSNNNEVRGIQFLMPVTVATGHVTVNVTTGQAASKYDFGFYNASGTSLLATTGGFSTAGTGAIRTALTSTVTLTAGSMYWFAWTGNNNAVQVTNLLFTAQFSNIMDAGSVRVGTSGTASSGGALNSSLGTMSNIQIRLPLAFFD